MSFDIFQYLARLAFLYLGVRMILHYNFMFIHFMVNSPTGWNNKIEKPRLLIYLFCGGFMFLMYSFESPETDLHFSLSLIRITTFILAFTLVHYSWTSKFKNHFSPPKNNKKKPSVNNFNINSVLNA